MNSCVLVWLGLLGGFPQVVDGDLGGEIPSPIAEVEETDQPLHLLAEELQREVAKLRKEVAALRQEVDDLKKKSPQASNVEFVRCVIESANGCVPCDQLWAGIQRELPPLGWKVGSDYVLEKSPEMEVGRTYPQARIERGGRVLERITGLLSPATLSHRLKYHRDRERSGLK